jgi:hypothetical protein
MGQLIRFPQERVDYGARCPIEPAAILILPVIRIERDVYFQAFETMCTAFIELNEALLRW